MILSAKNGNITIGTGRTPYLRFGRGQRVLLMLPGLGEGLQSIRGLALPFAAMYRMYARERTVYVLGRRDELPAEFSTRDMAADVIAFMDALRIPQADIVGISMGGMIAQHIAADCPHRVRRLVLGVTAAQPNAVSAAALNEWIAMAESDNHRALMTDTVRRMYSDAYMRRNGWMIPITAHFTKPKSYAKFLTMAHACLTHDASAALGRIAAPTLVLGGGLDRTLGGDSSPRLAGLIPGARLHMYPDLGHGAYDEAKDFHHRAMQFILEGD